MTSPAIILAVTVILVIIFVAAESALALAVFFLEGLVALAVMAAAALAGGWLMPVLGLRDRPWHERLMIGAALGIGALSLLTLTTGKAGLLSRPVAWIMVTIMAVLGLARLAVDIRGSLLSQVGRGPGPDSSETPSTRRRWYLWLWLLAVPFLTIVILAVCLPPGILWEEEAGGYDVLEYHLAVPKTFHDEGRISFLPYNVYSNFPMNSEMLSLFMMSLHGNAIGAASMSQFANVALAILWVAAAWLAGRFYSPRAGMVTGVLAAATPWIAYLAGIAYVEIGMLAMGMAALAALQRVEDEPSYSIRWTFVAGLLAGLSCGYKYTAVPLIALPLATTLCVCRVPLRARVKQVALFTFGVILTFSPWLARNYLNTHNPVFPLAYSVFGSKPGLWDDELEKRWQRAHGSAKAEHSETSIARRAIQRTFGDDRMGPALFLLAACGVLAARDHRTLAMVVVLAIQVVVWLWTTHLFARFAVVFLIPLVVLAGRTLQSPATAWRAGLLYTVLVVGSGLNLYRLGALYYHHTRIEAGSDQGTVDVYDKTAWFVEGQWPGTRHIGVINKLDNRARVMLLGEARTFYIRVPCDYAVAFNHHPLAQAAREIPDDNELLQWLRKRGITHLLAHWAEMNRLDQTYGLDRGLDDVLVERLMQAGLKECAVFAMDQKSLPYATLFEVPGNE